MPSRAIAGDKLGPRERRPRVGVVGSGYGVTNPMSNARATRAGRFVVEVQMDLFDGAGMGGDAALTTQAKRGGKAGRSPA